MSTPFVSCLCLTYNRAPDHLWLLGEAVDSYVRQDYPPDRRELIVLNDTPGQTLSIPNVDGVHVVNIHRRFRSLGEKYTAGMGMCRGDIIMWWDDDDISLPWRVRHSVEQMGDADYYNPGGYWFWNRDGLQAPASIGPCFNCSAFTRSGYERCAVLEFGMHLDQMLHRAFTERLRMVRPSPSPPSEWSYIYRWGVSPEHVSGWGMEYEAGSGPGRRGYDVRGKQPVLEGDYEVSGRWQRDYVCYVYGMLEQQGRQ